jgi:hypothetical protein
LARSFRRRIEREVMNNKYVDLEVKIVSESTFNVVSEDDMHSILKKAQELLNDNLFGIEFVIKHLEITGTGENDLDFDSTIYADGTPRQ